MNMREWSKQKCILDAELGQIKAIAANPYAGIAIVAIQQLKIRAIKETPSWCFKESGGIDKRRHRRHLRSFKKHGIKVRVLGNCHKRTEEHRGYEGDFIKFAQPEEMQRTWNPKDVIIDELIDGITLDVKLPKGTYTEVGS